MLDNILALGVGQVFTWISSTVLVLVLPRYLGDESLGKFAAAVALTDICGLLGGFGVTTYLTKEVSRYTSSARELVLNSLALRIPMAAVACLLAILAAFLIGYAGVTLQLVFILCLNIALNAFAAVLLGGLQGLQAMRLLSLVNSVAKAFMVAIVVVLLTSGHGVVSVALAWTGGSALVVAGYTVCLLRRNAIGGRIVPRTWPSLVGGGAPFFLWSAALMVYGQSDILLLSILSEDRVVGWYAAAYRLISIPSFIPVIVTSAIFPALASLTVQSRHEFVSIARRGLRLILVASIPCAVGLIVIERRLIDLLGYPDTFSGSLPLITILALHIPLVGADMAVGSCLNALDRQKSWALVGVAAAIINPCLNLVLIPYTDAAFGNGAIGAATVTVFTEAFMMAAGLMLLRGEVFGRDELTLALRCLVGAGLMGLAVWISAGLPLPVSVCLGAGAYICLAVPLRLITAQDLLMVRTFSGSRREAPAQAT